MKTHYKLAFVKNTIHVIDKELLLIENIISESEDPDSFGVIDQYEQLIGIGFTVCQTFLASVHNGNNKTASLKLEPFHSSGNSYALIINACANYWKHNDEWDKDNLSNQSKLTISIVESLGIDIWSCYPLSQIVNVLCEKSKQNIFSELLDILNLWSENVN